jgi:hypothetical protein
MQIDGSFAHLEEVLAAFGEPKRIYRRDDVLTYPCPVPPLPGIYAWFFLRMPVEISFENCIASSLGRLLYVGISPHGTGSTQNLRKRIVYHYRGNAYGSTLRLTLGVLLSGESGFPLRRVGSGKRLTFTHAGEQWLDRWMADNAFVTWHACSQPWVLEGALLHSLRAPLNIAQNSHEVFSATLSTLRRHARAMAREMSIVDDQSQTRRSRC